MEKSFSERVAEAKAVVSPVSPHEAHENRESDPNTVFIDPRDASDISSTTGIIPGAHNVPLSEISTRPEHELPRELSTRTGKIITACQGGPMGALAAYALKQRGYDNVHYIDGGTEGWLNAGYSTAR